MMNEFSTILLEAAESLGIVVSADEMARFVQYQQLVLEANVQMNLTAITDPREMAIKHFIDSLSVELLWQPKVGERVLDIGTGAGFPGLPLAIRHPKIDMMLNDSARKKVDFLQQVITSLELANCTARWNRAEEIGRMANMRGKFDVVLVRAVAHLAVLLEYAMPLLKVGGFLLAMKGPSGEREVTESTEAMRLLGAKVTKSRVLQLPGAGERQLIMLRKMRETPVEFPRNSGQARKKPLYLDKSAQKP